MDKLKKIVIGIIAIGLSVLFQVNISLAAETIGSGQTTFLGILIDADCSGTETPEKHTKACNLMPGCSESGYGIDQINEQGKIQFYKFDEKGQELAKSYLDTTKKENNLAVIVTGRLVDGVILVAKLEDDIEGKYEAYKTSLPKQVQVYGWLEDVHCWQTKKRTDPRQGTKHCLLMENCAASGYGVIYYDDNDQQQFYPFNEEGNKLVLEKIIQKTSKENNLSVLITGKVSQGVLKIEIVEETDEKEGFITRKSLAKDKVPTRDQLTIKEGNNLDYGILTNNEEGYHFYTLDEEDQSEAKKIVDWYNKNGENTSIPVLAKGVFSEKSIAHAKLLREREITGTLASAAGVKKDLKVTAYTKDYLLSKESVESGYGYFVKGCSGHTFYPFDAETNAKIETLLKNSKEKNVVTVSAKGYWYWIGNIIKVTDIQTTKATENSKTEEVNGILATRNYYLGEEYQNSGVPGNITKQALLSKENETSGYGILYKTCCKYGYYRLDEVGGKKVQDILKTTKNTSNIEVTVVGKIEGDEIKVQDIYEKQEEVAFEGILQDKHCFGKVSAELDTKMCLQMKECKASGYGIVVKNEQGEDTFYPFDEKGQEEAEGILTRTKKESNIKIKVKGQLVNQLLKVESIKEI